MAYKESLKSKTVKGVSWSLIDNLSNQGITFIVGIVLARLLSPEEFGQLGIILIFIGVFNSIVDSGFSSALVRKKDSSHIDFNTVFIFNLVLSFLLFFVLYFTAPLISDFFRQPALTAPLRVTGVIVVINAFAIIQRTILVKKIDFKTQTKISLIASISSGVVGICMALANMGLWSLVAQQISRQLLNTVFLWVYSKDWKPQLEFSYLSFKDLFKFGWKIMVIGLIHTIWEEVYQLVIGRCYSTKMLGFFTKANQFRNIFSRNIATVIERVSYPVLSSIQEDKTRLRESYRRIIRTTALVSASCMIGVGAISKSMILVLLGEAWLPSVVLLQIICFSGLWNPFQKLNVNLLQVQGKSGLLLSLEIIKRTLCVVPVLFGIYRDIYSMLWCSVAVNACIFLIDAHFSGKNLDYPMWRQVLDILPALVIAGIMGLCVWQVENISLSPFIILPIQIILGFTIVVVLCEIFKISSYKEIKDIVKSFIHRKQTV